MQVLHEMSSWCLQDLGSKSNRRKIETLVTIHVHQRDVMNDLAALNRQKKINDPNDFEWLKQARFYWRPNSSDECTPDGACVISITDVDFNYQYEYLGSKERLVVTPLTDRYEQTDTHTGGVGGAEKPGSERALTDGWPWPRVPLSGRLMQVLHHAGTGARHVLRR